MLVWYILFGQSQGSEPPARLPEAVRPHLPGLWAKSRELWVLLAGGSAIMVLGLADDRFKLDWRFRLAVQIALATILVLNGWRLSLYIDAPFITGVLSVLWIVGLVNSFNMLDNMDGLSAGVAAIAAAMLAAVMLMSPHPMTGGPQLFVAGLLLLLVGSLLGFLWHNRPPARLFMGDAGSYLIGYVLAMATLAATFASQNTPPHAILAPLCVLAVPLYDTLTVVGIRLRSGLSPFAGDTNHFSHRLVRLGMTKPQAVLTIYFTTATCGLGALLLHRVDVAGAAVILLIVVCILVLVGILEMASRRPRSDHSANKRDGSQ
jgi:UDP-GlcNAc:undecaprenyl-phosphate GlcNAc-1-phosphate transferase